MDVNSRLKAIEERLQAAEDQLEILRLLNSYGPLVGGCGGGSGMGRSAASVFARHGAKVLCADISGGQVELWAQRTGVIEGDPPIECPLMSPPGPEGEGAYLGLPGMTLAAVNVIPEGCDASPRTGLFGAAGAEV